MAKSCHLATAQPGDRTDPDFTDLPFWYCGPWRAGTDLAVPDRSQHRPASPSGGEDQSDEG
jgi:hypothetical protein